MSFNKGLILQNAYYRNQAYLSQANRLQDEFRALGVATDVRRNDFFAATITDGELVKRIDGYDFCIYLDKDKYVSSVLEKQGLRLFNSHSAIRACDDKAETFIALGGHGVPCPKTLCGLMCYDRSERIKEETLDVVERELGYPVIVKECYGSLGKGVFKADNRAELYVAADKLKCKPHLFQKFVASSYGRDMRIITVGGRFVAAMLRRSDGDFRSNLELGGSGTAITPERGAIELAERAAKVIGLDYAGVDVLFGENGFLICEVNSNAFFCGIERVSGVNVAAEYAKHVCREIYGR